MTDEELVAAANRGDARAFELLYERYRDWVVRLAFRLTGHREMALDVMQETFLYLLRKFPGFELRARMKTFLYPVVRHNAIAAATKRRQAGEPLVTEPAVETTPETPELEDLDRILSMLPDGQREVLILRFVDGLRLEEIATAMEIPVGTVKSRLHHALARIRERRSDEAT